MAQRGSSPPLITGIDGIVGRPPNEVNYSTLNGKNMETRNQPGNEIRRKFKKYGLRQKERYYVKEEENDGKIENLREPGNRNEIKVMKSDVESNGEEDGATTSKAQPKKCENPTSNTAMTNDNTGNSCTSARSDIDNGKVTNTETKSVPNDEGSKGEGSETEAETEAEAKAEADTNSEDSDSGNTGIVEIIARVMACTPKF